MIKVFQIVRGKVKQVEAFQTKEDAMRQYGGVEVFIVRSGWKDPPQILKAIKRFSRGQYEYHWTNEKGDQCYSSWQEKDFPTFKDAKAYALAQLKEEIDETLSSLLNLRKKRNALQSRRK